jgi:lysophospholipase L1-like esterase
MAGNPMPSNAELGPLARTTIRDQPPLDPRAIAGLTPSREQPRRIAFWGDSHIAAGPFMPTLISALRDQGLSVAPRFLPPTMGRANVSLEGLRAYCIGSAWNTQIAYTSPTPVDVGPALADRVVEGGQESYLWLDLRDASRQANVQQVRMVYSAPQGATVDVVVDDGSTHTANLANTAGSELLTVRGDQPISTLKLRVTRGKLVLHGFVLDPVKPPDVSFDVFGLPSATVKGWANANPKVIAQTLHGVSYDGVVFEYGTNEGADPDFDADKYAALLAQALTNMRQVFPAASCVLVGPPDRGVLRSGKQSRLPLLAYSRVHHQIETIQHEVGNRFGCVAWSWQGLMGGQGGSYGWAHAQPSLMGRDLIHLSPDGYRRTGRALAQSLGWTP